MIINSTGAYLPAKVLDNNAMSALVDTSDEWIRTRTGICERRVAEPEETPCEMGVRAARKAMERAGLKPGDISCLVVATMTPDHPFPSTACLIQHRLGLGMIPAFDVHAACSGFIYAMEVARNLLLGSGGRHALVIGTEKMSSVLDWQDRSTCVLFGDGAGAVVLSRVDEPGVGILGSLMGSDGGNWQLLYQPAGGAAEPITAEAMAARRQYLRMNGKEVFKIAVKVMERSTRELLERFSLEPGQIDCIIPHQANIRIITAMAERLELPMERFFINIDRYGNTSAASIPIALDEARAMGRIGADKKVLLVAFGAGLTWGTSLIHWPSEIR